MSYPDVTATKTREDGSSTTKYTHSFDLHVEVELHDLDRCSGCPAFTSGYSNRCEILKSPLPNRYKDGLHYTGRHDRCPLVKVEERI